MYHRRYRNNMTDVTVRDLRNRGGRILDAVSRGEWLTVTRDGIPVAEPRPLPRQPLTAATLLARYRRVPQLDGAGLKADIDATLDSLV